MEENNLFFATAKRSKEEKNAKGGGDEAISETDSCFLFVLH